MKGAHPGLTALITCGNEEAMIADCLASARFADEILVVDSFSTDRTMAIARPLATRILQHEYVNPAAQKNWAIPQAANEWVLVLDSDERATPELAAEIGQILKNPQFEGYWIRRRNYFWGKEIRHGTWRNDKVLRLFRRDRGRYQDKQVHEEIELGSPAGWCRERLLHFSYRSLDDYLRKASRYSAWGADDARRRGVRGSPANILIHSFAHFFKSYLLKQGFRDGPEGLIIAFMEGYSGFFKYAKLYEMERKEKVN
jgi:glycosyltransferase involved in cell wall biosynthesis